MRNQWFDRWSAMFVGGESSRTPSLGCHTTVGGKKLEKANNFSDTEKLCAMIRDASEEKGRGKKKKK